MARVARLLAVFLFVAPPSAGFGSDGAGAPGDPRPNLLLLLTDDQTHDAMGCAGNQVIETPEMDRLAAGGLRFRNAFVTSAVCAVSRASILTGQYPRRNGVYDFNTPLGEQALAEIYPALLREAGYHVGFIGKWGIGSLRYKSMRGVSEGFDFWAGFEDQGYYWHWADCPFVIHDGRGFGKACDCKRDEDDELIRSGKQGTRIPLHLTTQIVPDKVERFLDGVPWDRPFCLSVSFKAPHARWRQYPAELEELYEGVSMPVSATATPEEAAKLPDFLGTCSGTDRGTRLTGDHEQLEAMLREYYRSVTSADMALGAIRQTLARRGLAGSTVIVFVSDNGHTLGSHGLWGKWLMYEESIRVPLIVYDPRVSEQSRGRTSDAMVLGIDLAPTLLELAGLEPAEAMQGKSLVGLLERPDQPFRDEWFYEQHFTMFGIPRVEGVRTSGFKYVRYVGLDPVYEQLFDLVADPGETCDLADDPEYELQLIDLRGRHARLALAAE